MNSITGGPFQKSADLQSWPADRLAQLIEFMFKYVPPNSDPKDGIVTRVQTARVELRRLRDFLPQILADRESDADVIALEKLGEKYDSIKKMNEWRAANKAATALLPSNPDAKSRFQHEGYIAPDVIAEFLDSTIYHLVRSARDLQDVLMEHLANISKNVQRHLCMLYSSGPMRKRLNEESLQAYIECRLNDTLRGPVLDSSAKIIATLDREILYGQNRRVDIQVKAPTLEGEWAVVVIEIKWSDHPELSTSLLDQLGEKYLKNENLSHGIYLVGWLGKGGWKGGSLGTRPSPLTSLDAWAATLNDQAAEFKCREPDKLIRVCILDLAWQPTGVRKKKKRSKHR